MDKTVENGRQEASEGANATGKKPFFSIIIPVYNVAPYLRECLDSVLAQTFPDWEAICVDDGSTDGGGAILDEYAARDSRVRVIHQSNHGVSVARNRAIDVACGEYLAFLDADDILLNSWLLNIHLATKNYPLVDWVRTWHQYLYCNGDREVANNNSFKYERVGSLNGKAVIAQDAWWRFLQKGMLCINIYRKKCVANVRFDTSLTRREDTCFCAQLLKNICSFVCINDISYLYRQHEKSASHTAQPFKDLLCASWFMESVWRETCCDRLALTANIMRNFFIVKNSGAKIDKAELQEFRRLIITSWKKKGYCFTYFEFKRRAQMLCFAFLWWDSALYVGDFIRRLKRLW